MRINRGLVSILDSEQYWPLPPAPLALSNKPHPIVRKAAVDPRVSRSTHALGAALVELMLEEEFDNITVQSILDRAGVGRSTFYAHYRNKHDVLYSSYERMFSWLEQKLEEPSSAGARIVPVAEFVGHLGDAGRVVEAFRNSGQLEEIWSLSVGFFARIIERRIRALPGTIPPVPASLVARMLAGALVEMIKWWGDHPTNASPAQMDATFHALARTLLKRASYEVVESSR